MAEYIPFFYDRLANRLDLVSWGGFPLNPFFTSQNGTVISLSALRDGSIGLGANDKSITDAQQSELSKSCEAHRAMYRKEETRPNAPNVLAITHPWYNFLSNWRLAVKNERHQQSLGYLENLLNALSTLRTAPQFKVVFFDLPEHYAAVSSTLLERHLVDDVLFTKPDSGHVDDKSGEIPKASTFFIGGSYIWNDLCVYQSASNIWIENPDSEIVLVPELTLTHPRNWLTKPEAKIPDKFAKIKGLEKDKAWLERLEKAAERVNDVKTLDEVLKLAV